MQLAMQGSTNSVTGEQNGGPATVGRTDRRAEPAGCGSTGEETGRAVGSLCGSGGPGNDGGRGGGSRRGRSCGRRGDRVHRGAERSGRQQDQRDQGGARSHQPGLERSQGPGGWRAKNIKEGVGKEEAENIKKKFTEAGATVEVK